MMLLMILLVKMMVTIVLTHLPTMGKKKDTRDTTEQ